MKNSKFTGIMIAILLVGVAFLFFTILHDSNEFSQPGPTELATVSATPTPVSTSTPTPLPTPNSMLQFVDETTWNYYKEVSLYSEYGSDDSGGLIKKWTEDVRLYVGEYATMEDLAIIKTHIAALNEISGIPAITLTDNEADANMTMSFITQAEMNDITQEHGEEAYGYARIWWNGDGSITRSTIYIVYDEQTQIQRQHTILEEITQSLGLMNDSDMYSDSIFYIYYSDDILSLSSMDWALIRIHYSEEIMPGMHAEAVEDLYLQHHT